MVRNAGRVEVVNGHSPYARYTEIASGFWRSKERMHADPQY